MYALCSHSAIILLSALNERLLSHDCFVLTHIAGVRQVLPSLLAFDPTLYGLPAFQDLVEGVIPMEPVLMLKGTVVKGFGRGSKVSEN